MQKPDGGSGEAGMVNETRGARCRMHDVRAGGGLGARRSQQGAQRPVGRSGKTHITNGTRDPRCGRRMQGAGRKMRDTKRRDDVAPCAVGKRQCANDRVLVLE